MRVHSAITAYALEKYPDYATCVSAIINMWRTCGGFSVGYFHPSWIARSWPCFRFAGHDRVSLPCSDDSDCDDSGEEEVGNEGRKLINKDWQKIDTYHLRAVYIFVECFSCK